MKTSALAFLAVLALSPESARAQRAQPSGIDLSSFAAVSPGGRPALQTPRTSCREHVMFSSLGGMLGGAAFGFVLGRLLTLDAGNEANNRRRNSVIIWSLGGAGVGALIGAATPPCGGG